MNKLNEFAGACYDQNTIGELIDAPAAGYENCQYTLQASSLGGWIVRAVGPE